MQNDDLTVYQEDLFAGVVMAVGAAKFVEAGLTIVVPGSLTVAGVAEHLSTMMNT